MGIAFLIFVIATSLRSAVKLWQQRAVLVEFKVSSTLALATALYPIGMTCFILLPYVVGFVGAALVGLAAFAPGLTLSKRAQNKLQRAGTDRAKSAEELAATVFMTGIGCIAYFFVGVGISIAADFSSNPFH